jgi:Protein of unknown function (DUF3047)
MKLLACLGACLALAMVLGCASLPAPDAQGEPMSSEAPPKARAFTAIGSAWGDGWEHFTLPGKRSTSYAALRMQGRDALEANANSSASVLRKNVRIEPDQLSSIRFSWRVPGLIPVADLAQRDAADSPVRIVLAFEGDRSKFSAKNAMLSEVSRMVSGEPLPYATLIYVWCNQREAGTVITNPRTDRIRKLVVESGAERLNQWLDYERDVRADFEKAFGEPPGALVAIGVMSDADNTRSQVKAWYGPVRLASH